MNDDKPPPAHHFTSESHLAAATGRAAKKIRATADAPRANWVAVILAAGQGTRMRSTLPKVAHGVAGRTIVRHVIEAARAAGARDCVVVVAPGASGEAVRAACDEDVRFAAQQQPLGTGDAVSSARDAAGDAEYVLILNGDVPLVLPSTLRRLMAAVETPDSDGAEPPEVALLTAYVPVESYGFLELSGDRVTAIVETKDADETDRTALACINAGQYAARAGWLWPHVARIEPAPSGERYLTQLAAMAHAEGSGALAVMAEHATEVRGINDRAQLAEAGSILRARIARGHMLSGVTIVDPLSTFIDSGITIGADTTIESGSHLRGATRIGSGCVVGPAADIRDSTIGDRCAVRYSTIEGSTLESDIDVGPYSHIRPASYLCEGVHIGNHAEVKASRLGRGTKVGHFSYIGDAEVGERVNIGAGTITANYDGAAKHTTTIGDGAFIGSATMLVAPVHVGADAATSAGSVVNRDVPDGMIAVGAPARIRAKSPGPHPTEDDTGR